MEYTDLMFIPTLFISFCNITVVHNQSSYLVHNLVVSVCWRPTGTKCAVWCVIILKAIIPLLKSCNMLLKLVFYFIKNKNPKNTHYTSTLTGWLSTTNGLRKLKSSRMRISLYIPLPEKSRTSFIYAGEIKIQYFLNRPCTHIRCFLYIK